MHSPLTIKFMLACYCSPDPAAQVGRDTWGSPAGIETANWLRENDLIDDGDRATPRGKAWVHFILNTPLPIATWSLPERDGEYSES